MSIRRYGKKIARPFVNANPVMKAVTGGGISNSGKGSTDVGLRGKAAKRIVDQKSQAGGGQIKYKTEVEGDETAPVTDAPVDAAPVQAAAPPAPAPEPIPRDRTKNRAVQRYIEDANSRRLFS